MAAFVGEIILSLGIKLVGLLCELPLNLMSFTASYKSLKSVLFRKCYFLVNLFSITLWPLDPIGLLLISLLLEV